MRLRTTLLIAALLPFLTGCATLRATMNGWGGGADGLTKPQRQLREAIARGDFPVALAWKEDDALLRVLTSGATTYYAAQYARSAALLDTAALLADERLTASVSRGALAMVTNDMARPYLLRRTERLFVPYYGMLSFVQLGQWEDAAVEARRMVALLAQFEAERDDQERALHASMHYIAGAVFERAGETQAAAVAYRNAHALAAAYPEAPALAAAGEGDLLVVVERGFVAHRATEAIRVALGDDEREGLRGSDEDRRGIVERLRDRLVPAPATAHPAAGMPMVAAFRQTNVVAPPSGTAPERVVPADATAAPRHRHVRHDDDDDDDDRRHLTLAFPALRRSPRPWPGLPRLAHDSGGDDVSSAALRVSASVDDASAVDERRERAGIITRELARAAARYAMTKAVRDKKGEIAGHLADFGASFLERADVRSWHLLPQELVVMRLRLPAGQHHLAVVVGEGESRRAVELGPLTVKAGALTFAPARFWREPASDRHRASSCALPAPGCPI